MSLGSAGHSEKSRGARSSSVQHVVAIPHGSTAQNLKLEPTTISNMIFLGETQKPLKGVIERGFIQGYGTSKEMKKLGIHHQNNFSGMRLPGGETLSGLLRALCTILKPPNASIRQNIEK